MGGVAAGERGDMARVGLVELCHRGGIVLGLAEGLDMLVFGYAYRHHVDVAGVGGGADGKGHHEEQQVYLLHRLEDGGWREGAYHSDMARRKPKWVWE